MQTSHVGISETFLSSAAWHNTNLHCCGALVVSVALRHQHDGKPAIADTSTNIDDVIIHKHKRPTSFAQQLLFYFCKLHIIGKCFAISEMQTARALWMYVMAL